MLKVKTKASMEINVKTSMEINVKASMEINVKTLDHIFAISSDIAFSGATRGGGNPDYTPLNIFHPLSPLTEPNFQQLKNSVFSPLNI